MENPPEDLEQPRDFQPDEKVDYELLQALQDELDRSKRSLRQRNQVNYTTDNKRTKKRNTEGEADTKQTRRSKLPDVSVEQLEAETAWFVGLNANALSEEEEDFIPSHIDQDSYVKVC